MRGGATPAKVGGGVKVLLVEDSEEDAELVLRELRRAGLEVRSKRVDSEAALEAALDEPWDVFLSDFSMPHFDGRKAFEMVKRRAPDAAFIFVSGVLGEERAVEAMRAGARDYVVKGKLDRLGPVVKRELAEAAGRRRRVELEGELKDQERRYRDIFESAAVALFEFDLSGIAELLAASPGVSRPEELVDREALLQEGAERSRIVAVNAAAVRLMDAEGPEQMIGPVTQVLRPGSMSAWRECLRAVLTTREPFQKDVQIETLQGRKVDVLVGVGATPSTAGLRNVVVSFTDTTVRNALQRELRAAQRMEAVGKLAGGIAHDFNNILTVITSSAAFALESLREEDPLHDDIKAIQEATSRAASLTRQLLAFSRRQITAPRILSINRVVLEMDKMLKRVIGEDVDLVTMLGDDLGLVEIDPSQVEQILMNLAVNARDAMPDGGKITIETANVDLDAEYQLGKLEDVPPGEYVILALSDNGVGMDAETRSRVFEPFFSTKPAGKGTGLGLSTVYGIVKQAGGYVWVYSELRSGTTFKIYLPRQAATEESLVKKSPAPPPRSQSGTETILLVEDEEQVRRAAERTLKKAGYRVLAAAEGGEALLTCQSCPHTIHLVVTDIVMPGMNGKVLYQRLSAIRPGLKVLYMSGYTSNAIVHHGVLERGVQFIQKPFSPEALRAKVREALDEA